MTECPYCHCDPVMEFHAVNCRTHDELKAAIERYGIHASRIGALYDPDGSDPLAVIRDEYGVLRPVGSFTRLKNATVVDGQIRRTEKDVVVLEPKNA